MSEAKEVDVQYESAILAGMHEAARDLRDMDLISERTMAEFDELCLTPIRP